MAKNSFKLNCQSYIAIYLLRKPVKFSGRQWKKSIILEEIRLIFVYNVSIDSPSIIQKRVLFWKDIIFL